jgi:hypothetical protein
MRPVGRSTVSGSRTSADGFYWLNDQQWRPFLLGSQGHHHGPEDPARALWLPPLTDLWRSLAAHQRFRDERSRAPKEPVWRVLQGGTRRCERQIS